MTQAATTEPSTKSRPHALMVLFPVVLLLAIGAVWYFVDLDKLDSPEKIAEAARALRANPLAFLYVLLAFAAGTLLFLPVTALMLGTTLAFGGWQGFSYAFGGALLGACLTYWAGRLAGSAAIDYFGGKRLSRFRYQLRTRAFRASVIARFLPVGNFSVINMLAGSLRVPFGWYVLGNIVGIAPGVLLFTLFAERISEALSSPSKGNLTLVGVGIALLLALGFVLKRWLKKRELAEQTHGDVPS